MQLQIQRSIPGLMLFVLFVAVDLALLRLTYRRNVIPPYDPGPFVLIPALQAAVLLCFSRNRRLHPFWAGFLATGAAVLLVYSGIGGPFQRLASDWSNAVFSVLQACGLDFLRFTYGGGVLTRNDILKLHVLLAVYNLVVIGMPLLLITATGGLIAARILTASRWKSSSAQSGASARAATDPARRH